MKKTVILIILLVFLGSGAAFAVKSYVTFHSLQTAVNQFAKNAGSAILVNVYTTALPPESETSPQGHRLAARLQAAVAADPHYAGQLDAVYQPSEYQFVFVNDRQISPSYKPLLERIGKLGEEGIDAKTYPVDAIKVQTDLFQTNVEKLEALRNSALDEMESASLRRALRDAGISKPTPESILEFASTPAHAAEFPDLQKMIGEARSLAEQRDEAMVRLEYLAASSLIHLMEDMGITQSRQAEFWQAGQNDMTAALKKMAPASPHYQALVKELARYRELAKLPNFPFLDPKKRAVKGTKGPFVQEIQQRLKIEGYWNGELDGLYDQALADAIYQYQSDRQVTPDGKVEALTIERMNVPFSERVKQIKLALEKMRKGPERGGDYFVLVNVGGQELEVYEQGGSHIARKHRLIVGQAYPVINHTPLFSDEIEMMIYNPAWFVPDRIIKDEYLGKVKEDPEYFQKNGLQAKILYNDDGTVKKVVSITQPPGGGNALGRVKILFPNKHDVYLHDTPTKPKFKYARRTYSHGCMRVQDPLELARFLLEKDHNKVLAEVDKILEQKYVSRKVFLNNKVPIHIVYRLVTTNEQGRAVFFTDVYNEDETFLAQMSPE